MCKEHKIKIDVSTGVVIFIAVISIGAGSGSSNSLALVGTLLQLLTQHGYVLEGSEDGGLRREGGRMKEVNYGRRLSFFLVSFNNCHQAKPAEGVCSL